MLTVSWVQTVPEDLPALARQAVKQAADAYPERAIQLARRRDRVVGCWVLPLVEDAEGCHAKRSSRVLPYAAPVLLDGHRQEQREAMGSMLRLLMGFASSIELPLAPNFTAATICRSLGMAVEWRHTHLLDLRRPWRESYTATVAQHLRSTGSRVAVQPCSVDAFRFDLALVHQSRQDRISRQEFATRAAGRGEVVCLSALDDGVTTGQVLMLFCAGTALLMHSWFDRGGPRGVPAYLIDAAAEAAHGRGVEGLDLEGSVLPSVDYFMSGFGGDTLPVPHLYWHRDPSLLAELLMAGVTVGSEGCSRTGRVNVAEWSATSIREGVT